MSVPDIVFRSLATQCRDCGHIGQWMFEPCCVSWMTMEQDLGGKYRPLWATVQAGSDDPVYMKRDEIIAAIRAGARVIDHKTGKEINVDKCRTEPVCKDS